MAAGLGQRHKKGGLLGQSLGVDALEKGEGNVDRKIGAGDLRMPEGLGDRDWDWKG